VPPLSRRREDIPELARYFLNKRLASEGGRKLDFTPASIAILESYAWPGNITQLRNTVDWLVIMVDRNTHQITPDDLPSEITGKSGMVSGDSLSGSVAMPLKEAREQFETQYLISQLSRFNGNISKTAAFIGMERSALHRKLKNLGIQIESSDALGENE